MDDSLQSYTHTNTNTGSGQSADIEWGKQYFFSLIPGMENLDPSRPARRNIFLYDHQMKEEREKLLLQLEVWYDVFSKQVDSKPYIKYCHEKAATHQELLNTNLLNALKTIKPLERSYRNVALFFKNAGREQLPNISFINCDPEHLKDFDSTIYIDHIAEELKMNFDRVDLRNNYSLLVLSGYLGSDTVVEKWAKIAYENKVMIITDFENLEEVDDVMEMFETAGHASGAVEKSAVIMCCNWLVGRGAYDNLGEKEELYIPPSGALSGKIYNTLMSQVAAGKKFGIIDGVDGVKFSMKKSEIAILERMNLIPMTLQFGKVMAFSSKTLFNGNNLGLQVYSVVRVFDYVTKVLMDFLNRRAFENFNANIRKELMGQIVKFLDGVSGNGKLIEDFNVKRFEQDAVQRDKIHLDIHIKPYFPAKNFMIKMEGKKDNDGANWSTSYDQQ